MTPGTIAILSLSMSTDAFAAAVGRGASHRPAVKDAIKAGLDSGPGIPADQVFAELRARYADKS